LLIFIMGGLTFPAIAQLITEENKAKAAGENVGAKAADQNKQLDPDREPLDGPYTPLTLLAKLTAMCMVFGTASFMLLVFAGSCAAAAPEPSLADGDVSADQRQPAADP
jgi:hypothetical protein